MPISTPENWLIKYSNDKDHFKHVLDHLLIPSLEKSDLEPIPPIVKGSELIHGEIISNIETADLVLCDMSILNSNVFFELGIRTALNKPICLIKDDITPKIPFDTSIINHHTYSNALNPWILEKEIDTLSNHIKDSLNVSNDVNSLWKYFSLSSTAHPVELEKGMEGRIDYLTMQIEALRNQFESDEFGSDKSDDFVNTLMNLASHNGQKITSVGTDGKSVDIRFAKPPSNDFVLQITHLANKYRLKLNIFAEPLNKK